MDDFRLRICCRLQEHRLLGMTENIRMRSILTRQLLLCVATALAACWLAACSTPAAAPDSTLPSPPLAPVQGPGAAEVRNARVVDSSHGFLGRSYTLFEPADPVPQSAPVIIFMHGFGGNWPGPYSGWIDHLVQRGNIVIFPTYQASTLTLTALYMPNTIAAIKDALATLQAPDHVKPDLTRIAVVGHSMGGSIAANLAVRSADASSGVPRLRAMMNVAPQNGSDILFPIEELSNIPSDMLILEVVGDSDDIAGDRLAKQIFYGASRVPLANKGFVTLHSDSHGKPALVANHFAPLSQNAEHGGLVKYATDALDFYGYWKLFDGLTDAAFYGKNRDYAFGGTPLEMDMGRWSDGMPVVPLTVTNHP